MANVQKTQLLLQEQRLRLASRDLENVQQEAGQTLAFFQREFQAGQDIIAGLHSDAIEKQAQWEARFQELKAQQEGDVTSDEWKKRIRTVVVCRPLFNDVCLRR